MRTENHTNNFRKIALSLAAVFAGVLLSACGGGNNSSSANGSGTIAMDPVIDMGLWIANGTNVLEYTPPQLATGTSAPAPHRMINSSAFGAPQGVTIDAAGNLWVMDPASNLNGTPTPALLEFSAAQLAALGTNSAPQPITTITSTSLSFPQQSVFDAQGNQWVTDHNGNFVLVFTATQLAQTGSQNLVPDVIISSSSFNGPLGIAFDSSGTLWIANNGGVPTLNNQMSPVGTSIVAFLAGHLPVPSGSPQTVYLGPDLVLNDDGQGSIQAPWALTFDRQGNLWSSNANMPFTLVEFPAASRVTSGAPVPAVTISPTTFAGNATLNAPNGICFDNLGDLAAMNSAGAFGVALFGSKQLTTGAPAPDTFLVGSATTLNAPAGCNFGPLVN
jgi:sugar lactone lactonase YvrE